VVQQVSSHREVVTGQGRSPQLRHSLSCLGKQFNSIAKSPMRTTMRARGESRRPADSVPGEVFIERSVFMASLCSAGAQRLVAEAEQLPRSRQLPRSPEDAGSAPPPSP
jgi:hypothetical protein